MCVCVCVFVYVRVRVCVLACGCMRVSNKVMCVGVQIPLETLQ